MIYNNNLFKNLVANLQVNVEIAEYTHCWNNWKDIDYIPGYNKFYYICDGEGMLKINGKEFFPLPGQLFFMPAGVLQSYSSISEHTFTKYWCHFTAKLGDKNIFDIIQFPYFIEVENRGAFEQLFNDLIVNHNSSELSASFRAKSILLEMIAQFLDHVDKNSIQISYTQSYHILHLILQYIEGHLSENITVEQLAKICNFHPNYFIKFFKIHTGIPPIQYINRVRLEKAKELVMHKEINISEIANMIGFNDLCHFSKSFKNYTGFSPLEYRKINIQN